MKQPIAIDPARFQRAILTKFGSVREFARVARIAESTAYRAYTGKVKRPYTLRRLAAVLGQPVEYFFPGHK